MDDAMSAEAAKFETKTAAVNKFANRIASYVEHGVDYERWDKRRAVVEAITVLFEDIGAANDFFLAFGLNIDLYTTSIDELNKRLAGK